MKKPDTNAPVNETEGFYCMYTATLNEQRLLFSAEMDGMESDVALDIENVDLNECKFIELKVKLVETDKQERNFFRFTLRDWWCQCFLANIKKIIVGYRNEDGIVRELSTIHVPGIPNDLNVAIDIFI